MENNMEKYKMIQVTSETHKLAKEMAMKQGMKLRAYIEKLVKEDKTYYDKKGR
jgi:predicted HicB family RNase H-like nuclease